jgi:hypothetical protein
VLGGRRGRPSRGSLAVATTRKRKGWAAPLLLSEERSACGFASPSEKGMENWAELLASMWIDGGHLLGTLPVAAARSPTQPTAARQLSVQGSGRLGVELATLRPLLPTTKSAQCLALKSRSILARMIPSAKANFGPTRTRQEQAQRRKIGYSERSRSSDAQVGVAGAQRTCHFPKRYSSTYSRPFFCLLLSSKTER